MSSPWKRRLTRNNEGLVGSVGEDGVSQVGRLANIQPGVLATGVRHPQGQIVFKDTAECGGPIQRVQHLGQ